MTIFKLFKHNDKQKDKQNKSIKPMYPMYKNQNRVLLFGCFSFVLLFLCWPLASSQLKFRSLSQSEKGRPLDLGNPVNKTNKVKDEPRVMLNDPALAQAWGLKKSDAMRAWDVSKGSKKVIVAVIDTGIDINHEDFKYTNSTSTISSANTVSAANTITNTGDNFWRNSGETGLDRDGRDKSNNHIDDDGNGFVDDVYGWNFVSNNNDLTDNHGHGTHIAGIIGAVSGNGKGIAGMAPEVSLMILKYFDPKVPNTDNLKNTVAAIRYAIKKKANIINYSGGGIEFSKEEKEAIEEARQQGILFVAAAGNEKSNSDNFNYFPADYGLSNMISVTAIDPGGEVLPSSNYGVETVDIAAPGQGILSTLPNNIYGYMTGTSQATAFVTGAAVLVMAHKNTFNAEEVKKFILATGDSQFNLLKKTRTARALNMYKALTMMDEGTTAFGIKVTNVKDLEDSLKNGSGLNRNTTINGGRGNGGSGGNGGATSDSSREIATFGKDLLTSMEKTMNGNGSANDKAINATDLNEESKSNKRSLLP